MLKTCRNKNDFDSVIDKSLQHKIHNFYGNLRLSPLDGKLNRNFVPVKNTQGVGKLKYFAINIGSMETIHLKSKLIMKKPKELLLFNNKPKMTSILGKYIISFSQIIIYYYFNREIIEQKVSIDNRTQPRVAN